MVATFVNVTEEILKVLVHCFHSNSHLCNYTKTIIRHDQYKFINVALKKSSLAAAVGPSPLKCEC